MWTSAATDFETSCRSAAAAALHELPASLRDRAELAVLLADDAAVRCLNRDWRGVDRATNVLSFPNLDDLEAAPSAGPVLLGDVVLAYETVAAEAERAGITLAAHTAHLVVHGVLHLLGQDHVDEAEADAMEALEARILSGLGIADPYLQEAV